MRIAALLLATSCAAAPPRLPTVDLGWSAVCIPDGPAVERVDCAPERERVPFLCAMLGVPSPWECARVLVERGEAPRFAAAHPPAFGVNVAAYCGWAR